MNPPDPTRGALLALGTAALAAAALVAQAPASIVGSWHGRSTCVDTAKYPACHDEEVVYDITGPSSDGTVSLKADKIVDGRRVTMGELPFRFDAARDGWVAEFKSPRYHGRWWLQVRGTEMTGSLRDVPTEALVRELHLTKQ